MIRYLEELRELDLPDGSYAVFGSGPLAVRGLRENEDLDVLVTHDVWKGLAREHAVTSKDQRPDTIHINHLQILEVAYWDWRPQISDARLLISKAERIEGVPFVRLEHLLDCKMLMTGDKHARDVGLIQEYLGGQE